MVKVLQSLVVGIALVAFATVGHAETTQAPITNADPKRAEACNALAAVVLSEEGLTARTGRMLVGMLDGLYRQEKDMQELESMFPGMRDALATGLKPLVYRYAATDLPLIRADLATLYCANLTTDEANEVATFFGSSVMRKYTSSIYANMNYDHMVTGAAIEASIGVEAVRRAIESATAAATQALTESDRTQIEAFFASAIGKKMQALEQQKLEIDTKWINYSPKESEREIELATMEAMVGHVRKTDPKLANELRKELERDLNSN